MAVNDEFKRSYRHGTLVIWPPDDLRTAVNELRRRFDPASQAICDAHVTLTVPFRSQPTSAELEAIDAVASEHLPIEVEYGPLGDFLPYPCIYLAIRPAEPLRSLQRGLYELGLFNLDMPLSDPDEFIFHMSITDGYPDEEQLRLILEALRGTEPVGRFTVDSVAWIRPDARFHFETTRLFPVSRDQERSIR